MIAVLILGLLAQCLALLAWGMGVRGRIYEYPFLAGAVVLGWVMPQLVGLADDPFLPPGALEKTLIMTGLCTAMCWLGSIWSLRPAVLLGGRLDQRRLALASLFLSLFGAFFFYKISTLPEEVTRATSWSGIAVAYDFFSRVLSYGFVLALLIYLGTRSRLALAVLAFDGLFYFHRIAIAGRRWSMVEFAIAIGFALWLYRRTIPPRLLILAGLVGATLVINGIGQYRALTLDREGPRWGDVLEIDLVGNFEDILENGSYEMRNTIFVIEGVARRSAYDFGAFNWNKMIFNFVPAQIVGREFKQALMIDVGSENPAYDEFSYIPHTGTTLTGFSDAFASFYYFGCVKFLVIAVILRKLLLGAYAGSIASQLFYVMLMGPALLSITHHTQWFFSCWLHVAIFVLPVLWLCRAPPPLAQAAPPDLGRAACPT